jgi:HlyD family secretion protein
MRPNFYLYILAVAATSLVACQPAKPKLAEAVITAVNTNDVTQVTGIGRVEPENKIIRLNSEVAGLVTRLVAKAGQTLQAGDPILELSKSIEDSRTALAQSRIPTQQAAIADAQAAVEAAASRIAAAQVKLAAAQVRERAIKTRLDRTQALVKQGSDTQQSLDNLTAEYEGAQQDVRAAQAEITAVQKDRDRLQAAYKTTQTRVTELEADVKVAQSQGNQRIVRAPYSGTLLSMDVTQGSNISPTTAIGDFAPAGMITAVCEIDELFAARVQTGQKAYIRNQGMRDTLSLGTVIYAAPYLKKKSLFSADAGELEDRRVREVRIKLDDPKKVLLGARVDCVILFK